MNATISYIINRAKEPSSYAGIAAILAAFHVVIPADIWGASVQLAVALAGLVAVLAPEKKA
jgi:hypothetical protein